MADKLDEKKLEDVVGGALRFEDLSSQTIHKYCPGQKNCVYASCPISNPKVGQKCVYRR